MGRSQSSFIRFPEDEVETTVGQMDAGRTLVNGNVRVKNNTSSPQRALCAPTTPRSSDFRCRASDFRCRKKAVNQFMELLQTRSKYLLTTWVKGRVVEGGNPVGYIPKLQFTLPKMERLFCRRRWETRVHVLSAMFSHTIPCQGTRKHSSRSIALPCLALPCPVRALACRRPTCASTCS